MAQDYSSRRRFPRIPSQNTVLVTKVEGEPLDKFAKTRTVGLGGCGFISDEPLEVGSVLELLISVKPRVIQATGRVVYRNPRDDGRVEVGVEFLQMDPAHREVIEELLSSKNSEA